MTKRNIIFMAIPMAAALSSPVWPVTLEDLSQCYTRTYTASHLLSQPKQNVKTLALNIDAKSEFNSVTISGTNRGGQFGYLKFSCYENEGTATLAPSCQTFESDSQLWIEERSDGAVVIKTRNTFLSDIGGAYEHVEDVEDHYMFYLEEVRHSYTIGSGPFFHYRLYPAAATACPKVE